MSTMETKAIQQQPEEVTFSEIYKINILLNKQIQLAAKEESTN
jgi:hypothetical protein